jgi:hypothetical protein
MRFLRLLRLSFAGFLAVCILQSTPALAQSTATPVVPGYLSTTGCAPGQTVCWIQYGPGGGGATSTKPVTLNYVATSGAVQMTAAALSAGTIIQIPLTNTGTICIGASSAITAAPTSTTACYSVASGIVAGSLAVNNMNLIWVIGTTPGDLIQFTGN